MLILFLVDIQYLKNVLVWKQFLNLFSDCLFGIFMTVVAAFLNKYISQSFY